MIKTIEFYFLSFISILLQFIFLSILKEFNEEFLKYIEITVLSQIIKPLCFIIVFVFIALIAAVYRYRGTLD